jgi:hypothetical protein
MEHSQQSLQNSFLKIKLSKTQINFAFHALQTPEMNIFLVILAFYVSITKSTSHGCSNVHGANLIQISCANKNSNVQMLKAFFISCKNTHSKCISRVNVLGWLNETASDKRETFLLIDKVFDPKEHAFAQLLHPYLIQVSSSETIATFPLHSQQIVDVSCSENDVTNGRKSNTGL